MQRRYRHLQPGLSKGSAFSTFRSVPSALEGCKSNEQLGTGVALFCGLSNEFKVLYKISLNTDSLEIGDSQLRLCVRVTHRRRLLQPNNRFVNVLN